MYIGYPNCESVGFGLSSHENRDAEVFRYECHPDTGKAQNHPYRLLSHCMLSKDCICFRAAA